MITKVLLIIKQYLLIPQPFGLISAANEFSSLQFFHEQGLSVVQCIQPKFTVMYET